MWQRAQRAVVARTDELFGYPASGRSDRSSGASIMPPTVLYPSQIVAPPPATRKARGECFLRLARAGNWIFWRA
eukprot:11170504-Lingulodinium_polyedra.AAC.1